MAMHVWYPNICFKLVVTGIVEFSWDIFGMLLVISELTSFLLCLSTVVV